MDNTHKLFECISNNDIDESLALIDSNTCDLNALNNNKQKHTPLLHAIDNNCDTIALYLINSGKCCIEYVENTKYNPLELACYRCQYDVALKLIELLIINNRTITDFEHVFHAAVLNKMHQIIYILVTNNIVNSEIHCKNELLNQWLDDYYISEWSLSLNINKELNELREIFNK